MIVISDTNILSSFAAGNALTLLFRLFSRSDVTIPSAVLEEMQVAVARGRVYLQPVIDAIAAQKITILVLEPDELVLLSTLSHRLHAGERQAIVLAQHRQGLLLSNDQRAIRYCLQQGIRSLELVDILRLLWTREILSQPEVHELIDKMYDVEKLTLTYEQKSIIFAAYKH